MQLKVELQHLIFRISKMKSKKEDNQKFVKSMKKRKNYCTKDKNMIQEQLLKIRKNQNYKYKKMKISKIKTLLMINNKSILLIKIYKMKILISLY